MRPFPFGSRPVPLGQLRRHPLIAAAAMIITAAAVSLIAGCAAADQAAAASPAAGPANSRLQVAGTSTAPAESAAGE